MPIRVLSWNMYYGNINNTTPAQRFNHILQIAIANNVDIVFLQEHPGITSQFTNNFGLLLGIHQIPRDYAYHVFQEMNANIGNRVSASNRAYAILIRNTCQLNTTNYFNQNQFINNPQLGSRLRCPVQYQITHNGINYNFFNWHNEVANMAQLGINIFIAQNIPMNTVLVGDLNINANQINQILYFNNWDDVVVNNKQIYGVDHIMSLLNCNPILENVLNFVSDANHFPIAADVN